MDDVLEPVSEHDLRLVNQGNWGAGHLARWGARIAWSWVVESSMPILTPQMWLGLGLGSGTHTCSWVLSCSVTHILQNVRPMPFNHNPAV